MKGRLDTKIKGKRQVFEFEVPLYIVRPGYNTPFGVLELAGAASAIRAAWAHLVKNRDGNNVVWDTDVWVELPKGPERVHVVSKRKIINYPKGDHLVLFSQSFSEKSRRCFIGGDLETPSPYFMDAFRLNVPNVPVLREWEKELWKLGIEKKHLERMEVYGSSIAAWSIKDNWNQTVTEMIKSWHSSPQ